MSCGEADESPRARLDAWPFTALRCVPLVFSVLVTMCLVPVAAATPAPDLAMRQFERVQGWVRAWESPLQAPAEGEQPGRGQATGGVCVTLRLASQIVGKGTSFSDSLEAGVREASARAMAEAERRLLMPRDPEARREIARGLSIGIEMAGEFTPLTTEGIRDAALTLSPGIDGVAGRVGGGAAVDGGGGGGGGGVGGGMRTEAIFPEAMLLAGMDGGRAIASLAGVLSGSAADSLRDPLAIRRELGATFYTFRTTHLAQVRAGDAPVFLKRGKRLAGASVLGPEELASMPDRFARHLIGRAARLSDDTMQRGLRGSYMALTDRYEPTWASPLEVGVVGIGLLMYAHTPRVDVETAAEAMMLVGELIDGLCEAREVEGPDGDVARAMLSSAGVASLIGAMVREAGAARAEGMPEAWGEFLAGLDARMEQGATELATLAPVERAVVSWGLAARGARTGREADLTLARAAVRETFRTSEPVTLAGLMPWLGWAEMLVAAEGAPIPSEQALRQMRELSWSHQLGSMDAGEEGQDLVGGFIFTSARNPLPSAQSSRVLSILALMAGDERLTAREAVIAEAAKLLAGMRFLHELSVDETLARLFPAPERAIGGVRLAPWDQRMPGEATAMSLLAVCQFRRSMEMMSGDPAGEPAGGGQERREGDRVGGLDARRAMLLPVAENP